jgi:hypothetical protein
VNDEELRQRYRRDFTNEPIKTRPAEGVQIPSTEVPAPHPVKTSPTPATPTSVKKAKTKRKIKWRLLLTALILAVIGGGAYGYFKIYKVTPVPGSIVKAVDFQVIYPGKLPTGYTLQRDSFSRTGDIVQFKASSGGDIISFTAQARPTNVDFNSTFNQLPESSIFTAPLGQAATGKPNGTAFGIVSTDKSWLIISSASKKLTASDIKFIINNAKIAK